jgi:hypothetical protein
MHGQRHGEGGASTLGTFEGELPSHLLDGKLAEWQPFTVLQVVHDHGRELFLEPLGFRATPGRPSIPDRATGR